jgi:hypothetical protein
VVDDGFLEAAGRMSEDEFLGRYGPWEAMTPAEVAAELAGCGVPWWVAGGRAARVGATARRHDDTDVAVLAGDVDTIRAAMAGWHLWENIDGALRPLLPGVPVRADCGQLWVRRNASSPWRMEFLIDRVSTGAEWVSWGFNVSEGMGVQQVNTQNTDTGERRATGNIKVVDVAPVVNLSVIKRRPRSGRLLIG